MANEAHIRIDDGIKKGPRTRKGLPTRRSPKADIGSWVIPDNLDPDEILRRYLTETTTSHIAAEYGLSRKALTKWLREVRKEEWKQAQIIRALADKEDGVDGIKDATDALSLARARELHKASQFDLQSLDPDYQPKQQVEVTHDHRVTIEHTLTGSARELFQSMRGIKDLPVDTVQQLPSIHNTDENTE